MKFGQHLSSHLTPEWRKQYVNYEVICCQPGLLSKNGILQGLKKILYDMIGDESTTNKDGNFWERKVVYSGATRLN